MVICKDCRFWQFESGPLGTKQRGTCRLNPPTIIVGSGGSQITVWPKTSEDEWCSKGKLERRKKPCECGGQCGEEKTEKSEKD